MATAYINVSNANTGKGFITHEDWSKLQFEVLGSVAKVTGTVGDITKWGTRVGGLQTTVSAYNALLAEAQENNRDVNLSNLKAGFVILRDKLDQIITKLNA